METRTMQEQARDILAGMPGKRGVVVGKELHIYDGPTDKDFWGVKSLTPNAEEQAVIDRQRAEKRAAREAQDKAREAAGPKQSPAALGGKSLRYMVPDEKLALHRGFGSSVEGLVPDVANAQSFLEQALGDAKGAPQEVLDLVQDAIAKLKTAQEWARKSWEIPEPRPAVTKAPF